LPEQRSACRAALRRQAVQEFVQRREIVGAHGAERLPWHRRSWMLTAPALEPRDERLPIREFTECATGGRREIWRSEPHPAINARALGRFHLVPPGELRPDRRK